MLNALAQGLGELLALLYELIPNYGVAIILLTLVVRIAMLPLAVKQAHIMQAARPQQERMRKLQPELKRIREKHAGDRQKQYEETQKLFKENEVNQFAGLQGCLPTLIQAPIWFGMYRVLAACGPSLRRKCKLGTTGTYFLPAGSALKTAILAGSATFMGMKLGVSPSQAFSAEGPIGAAPYLLLIVLMGVTTWYQQSQMTRAQPSVDPQQEAMMKAFKIMPLLFVVWSWTFPTGLTLYWTFSNLWTIGQQFILLKKYGPEAPPRVTRSEKAKTQAAATPEIVVSERQASTNGTAKPKGSGARKKKRKRSRR